MSNYWIYTLWVSLMHLLCGREKLWNHEENNVLDWNIILIHSFIHQNVLQNYDTGGIVKAQRAKGYENKNASHAFMKPTAYCEG